MRRLLFFLALLALASPAAAASYYFSDCGCSASDACRQAYCDVNPGAGGCGSPPSRGTVGNPWCLNPEASGGTKSSFEAMMDGGAGTTLTTELAAGDTVNLCAGACDGSGTATWWLAGHAVGGEIITFDPSLNSPTTPITITPYCTGGSCETVTMSGDSNNDLTYDIGTEPTRFFDAVINGGGTSGTGYLFVGDPDGNMVCDWSTKVCTGQNLIIEKYPNRLFNYSGIVGGVVGVSGTEIRYVGAGNIGPASAFTDAYYATLTGDGGLWDMGCDVTVIDALLDSFAVFLPGHMTGGTTATFSKNYVHHNCAIVARYNGNCSTTDFANCPSPPAAVIFEDSIWKINEGLGDGHEGRNFTFRRNLMTDYYTGLWVENQMAHILIEDNTVGCPGDAMVFRSAGGIFGKCRLAIEVTDNNSSGAHCNFTDGDSDACVSYDIIIRRNKVFGVDIQDGGGARHPYLLGGIEFSASNATAAINGGSVSAVIENNMIWYVQKSSNGCNDTPEELSLVVQSSDPVTVRNNTIYESSCYLLIRDGNGTDGGNSAAVAHVVTNNLVVYGHGFSTGGNSVEMKVYANASGSTITNNNLHYGADGTGNVATIGASSYDCATQWPGYSTGNVCNATTFVNVAGAKATWDVHLDSGDTANKDRGTSGASDDIDKQARPQGSAADIGADELLASSPPSRPGGIVISDLGLTCHP